MPVGLAIFLTGLTLAIPAVVFGIMWYNRSYEYRRGVNPWAGATIGTIFIIVILWIIAIWMGVGNQ